MIVPKVRIQQCIVCSRKFSVTATQCNHCEENGSLVPDLRDPMWISIALYTVMQYEEEGRIVEEGHLDIGTLRNFKVANRMGLAESDMYYRELRDFCDSDGERVCIFAEEMAPATYIDRNPPKSA